MKVLLSWLRDFAPFDGDPSALGEHLTTSAWPSSRSTARRSGLDGIVVARVLATRPHPDADRIQLVDVDAGDGEALQIVLRRVQHGAPATWCRWPRSAPSCPTAWRSAGARCGASSPTGCCARPASWASATTTRGILVLPAGPAASGADFTEALGIEPDVLYDLEVNPNRPDAMSVAGVARDLAARLGVPFAVPEPVVDGGARPRARRRAVEIEDPDLCGRFTARVLAGRRPSAPSTRLVARRLTLLGMRPINTWSTCPTT